MGDLKFGERSLSVFESLPEKIHKKLFACFNYSDITKLRLVSGWFNERCTKILNDAFFGLKNLLETETNNIIAEIAAAEKNCEDADEKRRWISEVQLKYKIVQILKSEIRTLSAVCERYVKYSVYCFAGGKLLDYFYEIVEHDFNLKGVKNPLESHTTMQLFLLNEEFIDYFEEVIEPRILRSSFSPWLGVKIIDFLDMYVNSNYHITATYENGACQVSARYEILNPETTSELRFVEGAGCVENLQKFTRYVRNQMRWHNFFYYVDASYDLINAKRRDRRFSKFCLNSSDINDDAGNVYNNDEITIDTFNKTFSRRIGNPCSSENVAYAVELQCSKNCVPERLQPYVDSMMENTDASTGDFVSNELVTFENFTWEATANYDLLLTLKIVLPAENKESATENFVEVFHNCHHCELIEKSKEIPL